MIFIIYALANSLAILVSALFIKSVEFTGSLVSLLIAGTVLAAANMLLKPILKLLSFPLIMLSFGIFSFFISMLMLWITDQIMPDLAIKTFSALFFATVVVGIFNIFCANIKNN